MIFNKVGLMKISKKVNTPDKKIINHDFEGSVDYGEKLCVLDVKNIDFIELYEENRDVFMKELLDKNEEYSFFQSK